MLKQVNLALTLAMMAGGALAQDITRSVPGYVTSYDGSVLMAGQGGCVHSGQWSPAEAVEPCDPVPHVELPAPVVVVVEEAVVVAPPAPPAPTTRVVIEKVTLIADVLFKYNEAELSDAGKVELDDIAARIQGAQVEGIVIVGYTDRIASAAYNQRLSAQRAEAVKRHFEARGVGARQMLAEGKGKSSPVTGSQCRHMGPERASNRKLVDCLQPDRRVEIEVLGSREFVVQEAPAAAAGGGASAQ
jgi:OOP family OmpA-OmpF porin